MVFGLAVSPGYCYTGTSDSKIDGDFFGYVGMDTSHGCFVDCLSIADCVGRQKRDYQMLVTSSAGFLGLIHFCFCRGIDSFAFFLLNWQLLSPMTVFLPWLVFALINPWLQERYWRSILLDATAHWPTWLGILYTSVIFAVSNPLMWGVQSLANRTLEVFISALVMSLVWSIVYHKTHSLHRVIFSHFLVDLFNLFVTVFLNLYFPQALRGR